MNKLKIAFDFHGVLNTYTSYFKMMMETHRSIPIERIVLSGPPYEQIVSELTEKGFEEGTHYDRIISVVDWLKSEGVSMHRNVRGSWYCDDDIWWDSKGSICKEEGIGLVFDDSMQYKDNMPDNVQFILVR